MINRLFVLCLQEWYETDEIAKMPINELRKNLIYIYKDVSLPEYDCVYICKICIKHIFNESLVDSHLEYCMRKENHAPTEYVIFITVVAVTVAVKIPLTRR